MSDSNLTPDQDDAVRALLAAARHTDPTPPDVVARLDDELAALTAGRREVRAPDRAVTLASRRRRTAASLLLAAAAVVVVGVGIGQVLPSTDSANDASAGSAADTATMEDAPTSAESDRAAAGEPQTKAGSEGGFEGEASSEAPQGDAEMRVQATAPDAISGLSSDSALKPQVRRLRNATIARTESSYAADSTCVLPAAESDAETVVSVTFDDLPGALVLRVPVAGRQQVDVFVCGEPVARHSLTLRAP